VLAATSSAVLAMSSMFEVVCLAGETDDIPKIRVAHSTAVDVSLVFM